MPSPTLKLSVPEPTGKAKRLWNGVCIDAPTANAILQGGDAVAMRGPGVLALLILGVPTAAANSPPSAVMTVSPVAGSVSTDFQFVGDSSSDPDGAVVAWRWDPSR
jgi:hypothetical protein